MTWGIENPIPADLIARFGKERAIFQCRVCGHNGIDKLTPCVLCLAHGKRTINWIRVPGRYALLRACANNRGDVLRAFETVQKRAGSNAQVWRVLDGKDMEGIYVYQR